LNLYFPLALLLQAAQEGSVAVEQDPLSQAEAASALERTGFLQLILDAGPLAQVVFLVLAAFSVFSWAIAFSKYKLLKTADRNDLRFQRGFRRVQQIAEMSAASEQYRPAPLVTVFEFGYEEVARQVNNFGRLRNAGAVERSLQRGASEEFQSLNQNMGWLATTASATPFIGLFGTVWGVLEAFRGLGQAGGATLRAVAPGIAEALIATALGLFAAIPALIFFNYFSHRIRAVRARMEDFSLEFFNLAERNYGEPDGILEPQRTGTRFDR